MISLAEHKVNTYFIHSGGEFSSFAIIFNGKFAWLIFLSYFKCF